VNGFNCGPAHQFAALFGRSDRLDCDVGLVVLGVSPAQLASCAARLKRVISPISVTNTAAKTGPTPEIALDHDIARVSAETITGQSGDQLDLTVEALNHSAGRVDPSTACRCQLDSLQQSLPASTKTGRSSLPELTPGQHRARPAPRAPGISYLSAATSLARCRTNTGGAVS
jgi:hypothetical protein